MDILQRLQAYAADFEKTYADDDWTRLERHFTEDATYQVRGMPVFPIDARGRDQVFAALKTAVDGFDRRCDSRRLAITAPPSVGERTVTFEWGGTYTKAGLEDLLIAGTEEARFAEDGRIEALVDTYTPEMAATVSQWLARLTEVDET
jgi:hypothetical protein